MVNNKLMKLTEQELHGPKFHNILMKIQNFIQKDTTKQLWKKFSNCLIVHIVKKSSLSIVQIAKISHLQL